MDLESIENSQDLDKARPRLGYEPSFETDLDSNYDLQTPIHERSSLKSSSRLRYEAEVRVFKAQYGSLENVRIGLGLSRRKICQLLLVDPSAWTRWTKTEAPPHVYRSLEWYLQLKKGAENNPDFLKFILKQQDRQEFAQLKREISRVKWALLSVSGLFFVFLVLVAVFSG